MNEQLITGIYNNCINKVLEGVNEAVHEKLSIAYKKYLVDEYADTLDPDDDVNMIINIYTKMELKKWEGKTLQNKLSTMINDYNLEQLGKISEIGFKHAQRKLGAILLGEEYQPDLTEEQVNNYISQMKELYEKVEPYNLNIANTYLSEGVLDFNYAINKTDDVSLRINRMR